MMLEMSLEQGAAACEALDFFARISVGQIEVLEELLRHGQVQARVAGDSAGGRVLTDAEVDEAGRLCAGIKRLLGFERGASFGIGNRAVSMDAHRSYEVLCVLRQALAEEKRPGGGSVWHDGLRLRYTSDEAPKATVVQVQAG